MKSKSVYNYIKEKHTTEECSGFIDGYEKCQEEMADKKYTEEDMKEAFKQSRQSLIFEKDMPPVWESFEDYINSINKQD